MRRQKNNHHSLKVDMSYFFKLHSLSTRFDQYLEDWGGALLSLFLRIFISWQFLKAGLVKVKDWESTYISVS